MKTRVRRHTRNVDGKKLLSNFETMRETAELKALSNVSLERPLTDKEAQRLFELAEKHLPLMDMR